jgi:nitrile hydratase
MSERAAPAFVPDSRVVVRDVDAGGYKRRPDYTAGATGVVDSVHGAYRPPDGGDPERLYAVRFDAADLWSDADRNGAVYVDVWESGLAPAGGDE